VVDNPQQLTTTCLAAAQAAGVRLILQKGWGGLGDGVEQVSSAPAADTQVEQGFRHRLHAINAQAC
jgi:hypothetical protein